MFDLFNKLKGNNNDKPQPVGKLALPKSYMAKYITDEKAQRILNHQDTIRASCVCYEQLTVPMSKQDKLKEIAADHWKGFQESHGLWHYLFPNEPDHVICCDASVKNWAFPFTGTGFIPSPTALILLYYAKKHITPKSGHILIHYDDAGVILEGYGFNQFSRQWQKVDDPASITVEQLEYKAPGDLPYQIIYDLNNDEWKDILRQALKPGASNAEVNQFIWGYLYRLHSWYYIELGGLGIKPYCGYADGKPSLVFFTSHQLAEEYIEEHRIAERDEPVTVTGFIMPGTLPFIQSFQKQGIEWVCFNQSENGAFGEPIELLQTCYDWFLQYDDRFKNE